MTNSTVSLWLGCVSGGTQTTRQIEALSTSALFLVDLETLEGKTSLVVEMAFSKRQILKWFWFFLLFLDLYVEPVS